MDASLLARAESWIAADPDPATSADLRDRLDSSLEFGTAGPRGPLGAAAAVVVTASHNPPEYNGYKVYWGNGAQIVPPTEAGIAAEIDPPGALELEGAGDGSLTFGCEEALRYCAGRVVREQGRALGGTCFRRPGGLVPRLRTHAVGPRRGGPAPPRPLRLGAEERRPPGPRGSRGEPGRLVEAFVALARERGQPA